MSDTDESDYSDEDEEIDLEEEYPSDEDPSEGSDSDPSWHPSDSDESDYSESDEDEATPGSQASRSSRVSPECSCCSVKSLPPRPTRGAGPCKTGPHATSETWPFNRSESNEITWSVNHAQPMSACEPGLPFCTVRMVLSSNTPWEHSFGCCSGPGERDAERSEPDASWS